MNISSIGMTRQRLIQNLKARLIDGSLLLLLACVLVLVASSAGHF
jgi:hypothetical protein